MFDYIPQIMVGLIILTLAVIFCRIIICVWRWIGLNVIFKPSLDPENMPQAIWMKTVPLLLYFFIMLFAFATVFAIWDIPGISTPVTQYLFKIIESPASALISALLISGMHIFLLKNANKNLTN